MTAVKRNKLIALLLVLAILGATVFSATYAWLEANDMSVTAEMVGKTNNLVDILSDFDRFTFSVHENGEVEP